MLTAAGRRIIAFTKSGRRPITRKRSFMDGGGASFSTVRTCSSSSTISSCSLFQQQQFVASLVVRPTSSPSFYHSYTTTTMKRTLLPFSTTTTTTTTVPTEQQHHHHHPQPHALITRVRAHLPQLVEQIIVFLPHEHHDTHPSPSLRTRFQQELFHLHRRYYRPQQHQPENHLLVVPPRLEEWEQWCVAPGRRRNTTNDSSSYDDRGYGPFWSFSITRIEEEDAWNDDKEDDGKLYDSDEILPNLQTTNNVLQNVGDKATINGTQETNYYYSNGLFHHEDDHEVVSRTTTHSTTHPLSEEGSNNRHNDALWNALALLRVMTAADWARLELELNDDEEEEDDDDDPEIIMRKDELDAPLLMDNNIVDDDIPDDVFMEQWHSLTTDDHDSISMEDANAVLARLAFTLDLERDDAAALLMHEFTRRCQSSQQPPDVITYEILLHTLLHRLEHLDDATRVVQYMQQQDSQAWTPECLTAAIQTWNCRGLWDEAWELLQSVYHDPTRQFKIQNKSFQIVVEMAIAEQRRDEVLRIMEMAIKETKRRSDTNVEKIILLGLNGSYTKGQEATEFLTKAMEVLEERTVMVPGDRVWRHFIHVASAGGRRRKDKAVSSLIKRAFDHWAKCAPSYRMSDSFLSIGLNVSETLGDTRFALDLIVRRLSFLGRNNNDGLVQHATPPLPVLQIIRAVNICIEHGDVAKGHLILKRCSTHPNIHTAMMQKMYNSVLRGYAEQGDPIAARELLSTMAESSVPINQESLAVMIRSYALRKDLASAASFLAAIEDGIFDDVEPDSSIYGSYILTCVRAGAWQTAMDTYHTQMKERELIPTASTVYCLILAADKLGGATATEQLLQDVVDSHGTVDMACCILACSLLLPGFEGIQSMNELRMELRRRLTDQDSSIVREESLHLLKELRIAELDRRDASSSSDAWRNVLCSILHLVKAMRMGDDTTKQYS